MNEIEDGGHPDYRINQTGSVSNVELMAIGVPAENDDERAEAAFEYLGDSLQSISSEGSDPFGHLDYANTLVREMDLFPVQFTLGLFGDWGSGKSTILGEVGNQLRSREQNKAAFALFDAWRYEGDSLRREFIRSVGQELDEHGALREGFDLEAHLEAFDSETTSITGRARRLRGGALGDGLLAALLVAILLGIVFFVLHKAGVPGKTSEKVLIGLGAAALTFVLYSLQSVVSPDPVQRTKRRLEYPDQFARSFSTLLDNVASERLVIAIDNLDRCSPARVTEVLSSIKTFLEPAFSNPPSDRLGWWRRTLRRVLRHQERKRELGRLCFIVAADDNALRRHLTAQEMSRERTTADRALPAEVSASVEEYLRKFFGASLRIRDLLDEDVRAFTREQLSGLIRAEGLEEEASERVIEMSSQALKHNPRRIKQFVNNMRMRLQVLAERKAGERLLLEVDAPAVAKLAIIEEEYPDEYRRLLRDPGLLAHWHNKIRTPDPAAEASEDERDPYELPVGLRNFLRLTDDIELRDIRAYLKLKQTSAEMRLPRHSEFIEMLDDGQLERVGELLDEESGEEVSFTAAASEHLLQVINERAWSRAHNTLRVQVSEARLHGEAGKAIATALREALRRDELRGRLGALDASALMGALAAHDLDAVTIVGPVVEQLITTLGETEESAQRHQIAAALSAHANRVDDDRRKLLANTLSGEHVRGDFEAYVVLAEAMPEVLVAEVVDAALSRIEELGAEGARQASPPFVIAIASLRARSDSARLERMVAVMRPILAQMRDIAAPDLNETAETLAVLISHGEETDSMAEFAQWLASDWGSFSVEQRPAIWKLALALTRTSPTAAENAGPALIDRLFDHEEGTRAFEWLKRPSRLPEPMKKRLADYLAEGLAGEERGLSEDQLLALIGGLNRAQQTEVRKRAISLALSAQRSEVARELVRGLEEDDQQELIRAVIAEVREAPAERSAHVAFLGAVAAQIHPEQRFELAMLLAETLHVERGVVTEFAPVIGALRIPNAEERLKLVNQLLVSEGDMSDPENRQVMLPAMKQAAGTPASKARSAVRRRLIEVRKSGEEPLAALAARLLR